MRVLHVHSGNLYGGVETMLRAWARACCGAAPDRKPVFALSYEGRIAGELRTAGCEVHIVGRARAADPLSILRARRCIAALCRKNRFAATVVHSPWALALLAPGGTRPWILCQHDLPGGPAWTRIWSQRNRPDLVIANSRFIAGQVEPLYDRARVTYIHPCVELPDFENDCESRKRTRRSLRTPENSVVILQAARFEPWKGHRLLLEALASLRNNPDWILWIAGRPQRPAETDLKQALLALARSHGIAGRVVFLGHVDDVPGLMRAADIYCQPNTAPEPFGITYIEALHARLAVVATVPGGAQEILEPDWGLLAEPTVPSVAEALRRCLVEMDLRKRLGEAGPRRAAMLCHPPRQIAVFEEAIRSLSQSRAA